MQLIIQTFHFDALWSGRYRIIQPSQRRQLGRIFIVIVSQLFIESFIIIQDISTTKERTAGSSVITTIIDLVSYIIHGPVRLALVHSISSQAGYDQTPVTIIHPIIHERKEILMQVIHHRNNHILFTLLHPHLRVLEDTFVSGPTRVRYPFNTIIFPEWRTANLYPRFRLLYPIVNTINHPVDILPTPVCQRLFLTGFIIQRFIWEFFRLFRIADIIKMDAIYIVAIHDLLD